MGKPWSSSSTEGGSNSPRGSGEPCTRCTFGDGPPRSRGSGLSSTNGRMPDVARRWKDRPISGDPTVVRRKATGRRKRMLSFNSVLVGSEDPKALSEFYTKVLGEPGWQDDVYTGWQAGSGFLMVGPHSEVKGRNEMPGR